MRWIGKRGLEKAKEGDDWSHWSQSRAESVWSNLPLLSLSILLSTFLTHSIFYFILSLTECTNTVKGQENSITPRKQKEFNARQGMVRQPAIFYSDDHRDVWQTMTMDLISFRFIWHYSSCPVFPFLITSYPILLCRILSYPLLSCLIVYCPIQSYPILYNHILLCHVFCIITWHDII